MKPTGVNMTNVKQINRSYVLQLLLTNGAMSRTDLANALHLTTATLTSICGDFIQRGLITQSEKTDQHNSGRKKCPLEINVTYKYVVAISLHYNGHVVAITDLRGNPVAMESFTVAEPYDPASFFKEVAGICIRLLWEQQISCDAVLGACACIIGSVDQDRGTALHPFKIFNEGAVPVQELLAQHLPFPVCVESNVCAFLNAEMLFGDARGSNLLAVKWGPGVGSASSIGGTICKDARYHSCEIGHTYCYPDSNRPCKCGRTGCLETGVGLNNFAQTIEQLAADNPVLQQAIADCGAPTIDNINRFLSLNCPPLQEFTDRCARDLAIGVSNAVQIFSPDRVVLYGTLFETESTYRAFLSYILELNPHLPEGMFQKSRLDAQKECIGPAATAIKTFLIETAGEC